MVKREMKRALGSRAFGATTAFGLFMMLEGRLDQTGGRIFSDSEPYLSKFLDSLRFTPLTILWPITVMFPFVLSYRLPEADGAEGFQGGISEGENRRGGLQRFPVLVPAYGRVAAFL